MMNWIKIDSDEIIEIFFFNSVYFEIRYKIVFFGFVKIIVSIYVLHFRLII